MLLGDEEMLDSYLCIWWIVLIFQIVDNLEDEATIHVCQTITDELAKVDIGFFDNCSFFFGTTHQLIDKHFEQIL